MDNQEQLTNEQLKAQKKAEEDKKKKEDEKSVEEQKKDIAKAFGISLSDIEHVEIDNGKEFFKLYDAKTNTVRMVENRDHNNNLSKQFKSIQQELSFSQGANEGENAREIFEYNREHKNTEIELTSVAEIKANKSKYLGKISALSTVDQMKARALLAGIDAAEIEFINFENAIGIDSKHHVVDVRCDFATGKAELRDAKVLNYEDKKVAVDEDEFTVEITDSEFDGLVEDIVISEDTPVVTEAEDLNVKGEVISTKTVIDAYEMPEAVDKMDLSDKQRTIVRGLVAALKRKIAKNVAANKKEKVFVLENNGGRPA